MAPVLIRQTLVRPFSVFFKGQVYQGMSYQGKLYCLTAQFKPEQRWEVYSHACKMCDRDNRAVITVSPGQYGLWVNLHA